LAGWWLVMIWDETKLQKYCWLVADKPSEQGKWFNTR
jgi:hypothetical protein